MESLVISPISVLVNNPSQIEIDVLVSAVVTTQHNNPDLKIHISASTAAYKQRIQESYVNIINSNN